MKIRNFLQIYLDDPNIGMMLKHLESKQASVVLKGLAGSMDAIAAAASYISSPANSLFVLNDKEEAAYFHDDLRKLLEKEDGILLFPASCKKPFHFEEIDNANVLQRSEVL